MSEWYKQGAFSLVQVAYLLKIELFTRSLGLLDACLLYPLVGMKP